MSGCQYGLRTAIHQKMAPHKANPRRIPAACPASQTNRPARIEGTTIVPTIAATAMSGSNRAIGIGRSRRSASATRCRSTVSSAGVPMAANLRRSVPSVKHRQWPASHRLARTGRATTARGAGPNAKNPALPASHHDSPVGPDSPKRSGETGLADLRTIARPD